ncbi:MAG: 30S ribosomal protein S8 [Pseudomonadota bacterium]|nr:30S ribosomal protein S8 [Pseudomonadota bacterium]
MSLQFPIADMFTRIRNALQVRRMAVSVPCSKINKCILDLLVREGYITQYSVIDEDRKQSIEVILKYHSAKPVISEIQCVSRPSLRKYMKFDDLPTVYNGMGILIVSTSNGVFSDRELRVKAKKEGAKFGGEVIGSVV